MKKRLFALLLALVCVLGLLPGASATETVSCLTVDSSLVIIGDSNTVFLKKNNPDIQPARIYARVNAGIAECVENYSRYYADGYSQSMYQLISGLSGTASAPWSSTSVPTTREPPPTPSGATTAGCWICSWKRIPPL